MHLSEWLDQLGGEGFCLLGVARLRLAALVELFFDRLELLVRALVLCRGGSGEQSGGVTEGAGEGDGGDDGDGRGSPVFCYGV